MCFSPTRTKDVSKLKDGPVVASTPPRSSQSLKGKRGDASSDKPIIKKPRKEYRTQQRIAAEQASAWNPVFDVTPADLVDAIVTEKAVVREPNTEKMKVLWD